MNCTPASLASQSGCLVETFSEEQLLASALVALCAAVNGGTVTCTPSGLAPQINCLVDQLTRKQLIGGIVVAACNLANSGTGGGGVTCGNYGGGQPGFTPASGCGNAIDTSNGRIWWYYNGAWH